MENIKKIFIIIAFIILIIPMCYINRSKVSSVERRTLATYKNLYDIKTGIINMKYGKDFESWLKDRFLGKEQLIEINTLIKYYLSGRFLVLNNVFVDKKNKFFYILSPQIMYEKSERNKIRKQLMDFDKYCKQHKIKLYVVVLPTKEIIYPSEIVNKNNNDEYVKNIIYEIVENSNINLIFPLDEYKKTKEAHGDLLFFKSDTHMTSDGAFVGYNALMNEIQKDYPKVKRVTKDDFDYYYDKTVKSGLYLEYDKGNLWSFSGLPEIVSKNLLDTQYKYYKHKDHNNLKVKFINKDEYKERLYSYPKGSDLRVMLMGDSFTDLLMDILPYTFKQIYRIRLNIHVAENPTFSYEDQYKIIKHYDKVINNFNPDIIIIYINYDKSSFKRLMNLTIL